MTDATEIPSPIEEERRAIDRIARTPEGHLLHRYLRRILETVLDVEKSGALRAYNGRRTLARDLMRLMADGIDETRAKNAGPGNDPILTRTGGAVRTGIARRSVRERIIAEHAFDTGDSDPKPFPGRARRAKG